MFPFLKFPGSDILLGPGDEVHRRGDGRSREDFGIAFAKAQSAAGFTIPTSGHRVHQRQRLRQGGRAAPGPRSSQELGFRILATARHRGVPERATACPRRWSTRSTRAGPTAWTSSRAARSTSSSTRRSGRESFYDDGAIRKSATLHGVLVVTTLTAAAATVQAIQALRERALDVVSLQEIHAAGAVARRARPSPEDARGAEARCYLALSGGGAHAAAHAGVLRGAGRARACPVAGIAGVSGGALVAAAWAGGADLEQLVEQASRPASLDVGARLGRRPAVRDRLGAMIDEFLPVPTFEGLRVPGRVLATDVDTGEPVVFSEGDLRDAVRASCSFPGVFPPMVLDGRRLYDGGVSEVDPGAPGAREMAGEAGVVLAVDCNSGHALAGRGLLRGGGPARGPHAAARAHAQRAGRGRPGDRAVDGRVGLDAAGARSRSFFDGRRGARSRRRCPSCGA